jgi:hypothetical protein
MEHTSEHEAIDQNQDCEKQLQGVQLIATDEENKNENQA